jgi:hypothetical protein
MNSVVNEHSVIANIFLGRYIITQINPVITIKNNRSRAVRKNRVLLYKSILAAQALCIKSSSFLVDCWFY